MLLDKGLFSFAGMLWYNEDWALCVVGEMAAYTSQKGSGIKE